MKQQLRETWLVLAALVIVGLVGLSFGEYEKELTHRFVQLSTTPWKSRTYLDSLVARMHVAAECGYNGVLMHNNEYGTIENNRQKIYTAINVVKATADKLNMALIPGHFSMLSANYGAPMLSEASPARNTPFKVVNGIARCNSDHDVGLVNGGFDFFTNNVPQGWKAICMQPGENCSQDLQEKHSGVSSFKVTSIPPFARIKQRINVKPYRVYRISAWFKTSELSYYRDVEFRVKGTTELLNRRWRPFGSLKVWNQFNLDMNWRKCVTDFNSLNNTSAAVEFWFSYSKPQSKGAIWMDDMVVEEVGLYETMRRNGCPIVVKSADGSKVYKEGLDYQVDPKCSNFTEDSYWYEGHLVIPEGSSIQNGQELRVDWHKFADNYTLYSSGNYCLPDAWSAMADNVNRIDDLFGHRQWMWFVYDEWRDAFQGSQCELFPQATSAGDYLAGTLAKSIATARQSNNNREIYLYNDMYDPYHNSRNVYSMCVNGTANSWKGMDTSVIILNWNNAKKSMAFYMGLDSLRLGIVNPQIMHVTGPTVVGNKIQQAKELEAEGGRGIIGVTWVTWSSDHSKMVPTADMCKSMGWWGNDTLVKKTPSIASATGKKNKALTVNLRATGGSRVCNIEFTLPYNAGVDLRMVDSRGRTVERFAEIKGKAGLNQVQWNTKSITAGVYFVRLSMKGMARKQVKFVVF